MSQPIFKHHPEFMAWAGWAFFGHLGPLWGPMVARSACEGLLMAQLRAGIEAKRERRRQGNLGKRMEAGES